MQYLKHVVEDDVLFTNVISKFKPVTLIPEKVKKKAALLLMNFETLILRIDMFAMYPSFEMKNGVLSAQKS